MTEHIDIDALELRARTCQESGAGLIEPSAVIELIGRLRQLEGFSRAANGFIKQEVERAETRSLTIAFAEEPPCSCDEALALQARVRELEERNASQARQIDVLDHMLADDPEFCSEPEAKLRMAKLKLGAWLTEDPYTRNALTVPLGPNNFGTNLFIERVPVALGYGASKAESILDALKREESERPARLEVDRKLKKAKSDG